MLDFARCFPDRRSNGSGATGLCAIAFMLRAIRPRRICTTLWRPWWMTPTRWSPMRRAGRWRGSNQLFERDLGIDQQFWCDLPHAAFEQFAPLDVILHHIDAIWHVTTPKSYPYWMQSYGYHRSILSFSAYSCLTYTAETVFAYQYMYVYQNKKGRIFDSSLFRGKMTRFNGVSTVDSMLSGGMVD